MTFFVKTVLALTLVLALNVRGADAHAEQTSTVVAVLPRSGALAGVGAQLEEVMRWAAVDAEVGLIVVDSEAGPDALSRALGDVLQTEGVVGMIGPLRESRAPVVAAWSARAGIPALLLSGAEGLELRSPWAFRARMSVGEQAAYAARRAYAWWPEAAVGVLAPDSEYGEEAALGFVRAWTGFGGRVEALARYDEGQTQFAPVIETLLGARARLRPGRSIAGRRADRWKSVRVGRRQIVQLDLLLIADFDDAVARQAPFIAREPALQGAQLLGLAGWRGQRLSHAADELSGALFFDTFGGIEEGGAAEAFVLAFEVHFEREPTTVEAEVYDLVRMVGSLPGGARSRERLLSSPGFEGVSGRWRFERDGAPLREPRAMRVIEGGRWVPLRDEELEGRP
ncbi:hypothetical protein DL240_02980 [Lujinxingia litoralis]|uniref:Leucine-binding protein domain-containing protein n=1 Tax=Lujinxingia litoralis TaxID=2211119 RepID=A0A328CDT4_9DELT|nr:ABC transporter substrate-binding protein [Lujinxingia litoralis]RAL25189.1 hypothetical protein DL240_02980 [Lujinxingia litoralis]